MAEAVINQSLPESPRLFIKKLGLLLSHLFLLFRLLLALLLVDLDLHLHHDHNHNQAPLIVAYPPHRAKVAIGHFPPLNTGEKS